MSSIQLTVEEVPWSVLKSATESTSAEQVRAAVRQFQRPLVAYAHGFLEDWDLAQDAVQDTFIKLHRELRRNEPENLKAWLLTVCRNRCLDLLRKNRRLSIVDSEILEHREDSDLPNPYAALEQQDEHAHILRLLDQLPVNQREVIRLKFQADMSYREISEVTSLTESNVGYLLHHGLKHLREIMEREGRKHV